MTTRNATAGDLADLERMALRFLSADGPYQGRVVADDDSVRSLARLMLSGGDRLSLVAENAGGEIVGMFGAFCFQHPITSERVAAELCWWMEPEARGGRAAVSMLTTAESWAKAQGATVMEMIAPDERVGEFYGRVGYERSDIHYRKAL